MTAVTDPDYARAKRPSARRARYLAFVSRSERMFHTLGLGWTTPLMRLAGGEDPKAQRAALWRLFGAPFGAILLFLLAWSWLAPQVQTSLGAIPGPAQVAEQAGVLVSDHVREREREAAFLKRQEERNARWEAGGHPERVRWVAYTGSPTYFDQIWTSIRTVFFGFALAAVVAAPLGVLCGLSATANAALNPIIQIFKPVSPLAWLPIVTMVVSAVYTTNDGVFAKSFLVSAVTVTLCSLWPTLINTALGVASVDRDLLNVAKALRLSTWTKIRKLILPSALPLIFTGLRLSLGVGWMVLIAAEMLAQNPGLGKFVWDEFQNGSSDSLARIMVAVLTIGIIGFLLDRLMVAAQSAVTFANAR